MTTSTIMRPEASALSHSGDLDVQISTAKAYPRDVKLCVNEIGELATLDEETAAGCMYFRPQSGGYIDGYSIRFAELCMSSWGNLRVASRNVDRKGEGKGAVVTAEAICWDLEKNVARSKQCSRPVRFTGGEEVTEAAAQSIATRDAILAVVPQGILRSVRERVREVVLGSSKNLEEFREKVIRAFADLGVSRGHLEQWVGRTNASGRPKESSKWTGEDVFVLRTLGQNIRNGERSTMNEFGVSDKRKAKSSEPSAEAAEMNAKFREAGERAATAQPNPGAGTEGDPPSGTPSAKAELLEQIASMTEDMPEEPLARVCKAVSVSNLTGIASWSTGALQRLWKAAREELA